jgi:mlo protein
MLLGFISLLLTVSQGVIQRTCIPPSWTNYMLPCKKMEAHTVTAEVLALGGRRLLSESGPRSEHCQNKVAVPWTENSFSRFKFFLFIVHTY